MKIKKIEPQTAVAAAKLTLESFGVWGFGSFHKSEENQERIEADLLKDGFAGHKGARLVGSYCLNISKAQIEAQQIALQKSASHDLFPLSDLWAQELKGKTLAHFHSLAVASENQRQGFGKILLQDAIERARSQKAAFMILRTGDKLPWLKPWYESLGFQIISEQKMPDLKLIEHLFLLRL